MFRTKEKLKVEYTKGYAQGYKEAKEQIRENFEVGYKQGYTHATNDRKNYYEMSVIPKLENEIYKLCKLRDVEIQRLEMLQRKTKSKRIKKKKDKQILEAIEKKLLEVK